MTASNMQARLACQVCGLSSLRNIEDYTELPRITSDCRPFESGGKLSVCMHCGAVQKIVDDQWLAEILEIYSSYQAYSVADGEEQYVLDIATGLPKKRSSLLMKQLNDFSDLPAIAKVIDIGCGDGVTLKAMSEIFPGWELYGHEIDNKKLPALSSVSAFKKLYTGDISKISETFQMVSMVHSLEHFAAPLQILKQIRDKLDNPGYLFVEVCNVDENPFDILVADHLMHFSPHSLANLARRAGFKPEIIETNWVKKEISMLAKTAANSEVTECDAELIFERINSYVAWLDNLIHDVRKYADSANKFGIFGTSIAASWLKSAFGDSIDFFVDEDPNRVGRSYMGKPVLAPDSVDKSSTVYFALAPTLAGRLAKRFSNFQWSLIQPPTLSASDQG